MVLKNIISGNVFLYKIWFYSVLKKRNTKLRLPMAGDRFYFDGYPRSGNTFTIGLIERIYPSLKGKGSHHLHSIAGIKLAIKNNLPIVVMIRNPEDAIISYLYTKKEYQLKKPNLIDELTIEYITYYNFVLNFINRIKIIHFDEMIKNKRVSIQRFGNWLELNPEVDIDETIVDYENRMRNSKSTTFRTFIFT